MKKIAFLMALILGFESFFAYPVRAAELDRMEDADDEWVEELTVTEEADDETFEEWNATGDGWDMQGEGNAEATVQGESEDRTYEDYQTVLSDGVSSRIYVPFYISGGDASIDQITLRNEEKEIVICEGADYLFECGENAASDTCFDEFIIYKSEVPAGCYDIILHDSLGNKNHIYPDGLEVTKKPAIGAAGWANPETCWLDGSVFSLDMYEKDYVAFWVYGINLDSSTVPVLWQDSEIVTGKVLDCEPLEEKKGVVYKLERKSNFSEEKNNTDITIEGDDYILWTSYYGDAGLIPEALRLENYGIYDGETHSTCTLNCLRLYLSQSFAAESQSVGIELQDSSVLDESGSGYRVLMEKTFRTVQKDAYGRLYVELEDLSQFVNSTDFFAAKILVTNKSSQLAVRYMEKCQFYEGDLHLSNLEVPEGCRWQLMKLSDVGKVLFEGNQSGKAVLTESQLEEVRKYGAVRINILKGDVVVSQFRATFQDTSEMADEDLIETVAKAPAPRLEVVSRSETTRTVDIRVKNPEYVLTAPEESLQYLFTITDAQGNDRLQYAYVEPAEKQTVTLEIPDLTGGKYSVTVKILYVINRTVLATGKTSAKVSFTLVTPYEKNLYLKLLNNKVYQGDTTENVIARVLWKNADVDYRNVSIELKRGPKGCNLELLKNAMFYDTEDACLKLRVSQESAWDGVVAGGYTFAITAMQQAGKEPAHKELRVWIGQSPKTIVVKSPLTRYYKTQGRNLKIRPVLTEYDYAGAPISSQNRGKTTFSIRFYNTNYADLVKMNPDSGVVTIAPEFGQEGDKVVFAIVAKDERGKSANSWDITVSSEKRSISSIKIGSKEETQLQGVFAYEIDEKSLVLRDQDNLLISANDVSFSVKGSSVRVAENGTIQTTGKAGKATITAKLKDGSASKAQITLDVWMDKVHLKAYHEYAYDVIPMTSCTAETPNVINTIIYNGDPILFRLVGSNGKVANKGNNAIDYTIKSQTGKLYDYGKARDRLKYGSGEYIYIPKEKEDVITIRDRSTNPVTVTQYKIVVPSLDESTLPRLTAKQKNVTIYQQMNDNQTVSLELKQNVDYTGYTAVLDSDYGDACKSYDTWRDYKYIKSQFQRGTVVNKNTIVFPIVKNDQYNLPTGTYKMKVFLCKGKDVLPPISLQVTVRKIPRAQAKLASNPVYINRANKVSALEIETIRAQSIVLTGAENYVSTETNRPNAFIDYFEVETVDGRPRIRYKGKDSASITTVPANDRKGVICYTITDLAGFEHQGKMSVIVKVR